jgi:large subunit ribosomal protein L16
MLFPARVKYRKHQRGKRRGLAVKGSTIAFGEYGLKSLESAWLKSSQLEAARVILSRRLHRGGKLWIRVFPDKSITKHPAEARMGKGKGEVETWVAVIKRGMVLFEMGGVPQDYARSSFRLIAYKLPCKTMFITRRK